MSHIDEGALHAYLDGALDSYPAGEAAQIRSHLASCGDCAQRLEEERGIREEAESILAASAPVVQMPPLEDLRMLAKRRAETSQVRRMSLVNRWGWAASVVLALGSGWMLRGAIPGMISRPVPREQAAEPIPTAPAADGNVGGVILSEQDRQQDSRGADAETDPATGSSSGERGNEAITGFTDADEFEVRAEVQPEAQPEEQAAARDAPAVAEEAIIAPMTSAPPPPVAQAMADVVDSLARGREAEEQTPTDRAERPVVVRRAAPVEATQAPSSTVEDRSADRFLRLDDVVAAKSILDGDELSSLTVPGLEVVDRARFEDSGLDGVVLVRQVMENGDTLEVFHLPAGFDPSALPPAPADGRKDLSAPNGDGWIVLRAKAQGDQLEEYLRRILGG